MACEKPALKTDTNSYVIMTSTTPLLEIEDLHVSYLTRAAEVPAVIDFSLTVNEGETVGLVGESGCGKSTVAMAIMNYMGTNGLIKSGSIRFRGQDITTLGPEQMRVLRGNEIAMIYQEPMASLNPAMTVAQQLMEVPILHLGASEQTARASAETILSDVHIPDPERIMASYPHQISGGQQQRVVIAMALLANPSLLLLDEPTTALDVTVEAGIVKLVREIASKYEMTQVYISHNLGLILQTCSRVCVMYSGQAVEEGPVSALFGAPKHPYTHGLFNCIPLPKTDKRNAPLVPIPGQLPLPHERPTGCTYGPRCQAFEAKICDQGTVAYERLGESNQYVRCARWSKISANDLIPNRQPAESAAIGDLVIEADQLSKYYVVEGKGLSGATLLGRKEKVELKANQELNLSARHGETLAIVGESGCGKSTFAKVLLGLETSTSGELTHDGQEVGKIGVQKRTQAQLAALQIVFQNPVDTLNPSHTVGAQVGRVLRKFGIAQGKKDTQEKSLELLAKVKLPDEFFYRLPRQLSGGQKQRIGIARAFAGRPTVVVADEPVSALDVSVQAAITELLMEIQREYGTTLLLISHDLSVVRYLSDRVVVMYLGRIVESGSRDQIFEPPYHPYTEALLAAAPIADLRVKKRDIILEGNLPDPINPPKGCPFSTRCPRHIGEICDTTPPPEHSAADGHRIACHIPLEELSQVDPVFAIQQS